MKLVTAVQQIEPEMVAWRKYLHANPELGFEELETARFVSQKLEEFGIEVAQGVGGPGVVGTLHGTGGPGLAIGIRAELDALPMTEAKSRPHASRHPGRMHACGHDGHMAILLGAAKTLAANPQFSGTVRFIFQPAEEGRGGARAMLNDRLFDKFPCDEIYALHNSERNFGQVVIYEAVVAAAADRFEIEINGRGGHAATPHLTVDPIPIAARLLLAIEALPGRLINVSQPAIVTVGKFQAGEAFNTIPDVAKLAGTVRCFDPTVRDKLEYHIRKITLAYAGMYGASATINYESPFAPTVNWASQAKFAGQAAESIVGKENMLWNPTPEMGSEDFSFMLQKRPGCYFLLGQNDIDHQAAVHDTNYDFNDAILTIGASIWVRLVEQRLKSK